MPNIVLLLLTETIVWRHLPWIKCLQQWLEATLFHSVHRQCCFAYKIYNTPCQFVMIRRLCVILICWCKHVGNTLISSSASDSARGETSSTRSRTSGSASGCTTLTGAMRDIITTNITSRRHCCRSSRFGNRCRWRFTRTTPRVTGTPLSRHCGRFWWRSTFRSFPRDSHYIFWPFHEHYFDISLIIMYFKSSTYAWRNLKV